MAENPLRRLPSVDALVRSPGGRDLVDEHGRSATVEALRAALSGARAAAEPLGEHVALPSGAGRFARNAVVQGAAAELFKAWAATVRDGLVALEGRVVLCLHDELLVHAPAERADEVAALVDRALADASRRWAAGAPVRFVADTSVISRWSEAKD